MIAFTFTRLFAVMIVLLSSFTLASCSPQDGTGEEGETTPKTSASVLTGSGETDDAEESSEEPTLEDTPRDTAALAAAKLAARLANDRCEQLYGRRPFSAAQHPAVIRDDKYHWGGLDVAGSDGISAYVTFGQDGSNPRVKVYYSDDTLSPF